MSILFLDSSALVKRYLTETGSVWVAEQTALDADNLVVVAEITRVEVASALAARQRSSSGITISDATACSSYWRSTTHTSIVPRQ